MKIPGGAALRFVISIASFLFTEQQFVMALSERQQKHFNKGFQQAGSEFPAFDSR